MCCMLLGYSFKPRPKYLCTWYIMLSNEHWFTIKQMLALRLVQEFGLQRLLKLDVSGRSSFSPPWSRRGLKEALCAGCYNQLQKCRDIPMKTQPFMLQIAACHRPARYNADLLPPHIQSCSPKFWAWSWISSNFDNGVEGGSQAQDHGQAIYANIWYSVSSTFATGFSFTTLDCTSAGTYFWSNWSWNRSMTSSWNQNSWRHTTCRLGVWLAMRSTIARNLGTYKLGLELSHWPHHPLKYNDIITWFH